MLDRYTTGPRKQQDTCQILSISRLSCQVRVLEVSRHAAAIALTREHVRDNIAQVLDATTLADLSSTGGMGVR